MPCYRPISGYLAPGGGLDFRRCTSTGIPLSVPCGQCIGCRIDKQRDWSIRINHEARLWPRTVFLTLTYSDESLPPFGTLSLRHWQLFAKRLRRHVGATKTNPVRFVANGEYGTEFQRPHYHAIVFNYASPDRQLWKRRPDVGNIWQAPTLEKLWGKGIVTEQDFDPAHGDYLAQHCVKRLSAEKAEPQLERICPFTGESRVVLNEFWTMSRRPGIGHGYFEKYGNEIWAHDSLIHRGREVSVPRYYDRLRSDIDPARYLNVKDSRIAEARKPERRANNTPERLATREVVTRARMALKPSRKLK